MSDASPQVQTTDQGATRRRRVWVTAGYVLMAESVFAALAALIVGGSLDAGFRDVPGGLLGALAMPGAPHALEGIIPFLFDRVAAWALPLLALVALHACWALFAQGAWLAALAGETLAGALRWGFVTFGAALRLRVLALVPAAFVLALSAILAVYAHLVFRGASERSADLAVLAALALGACLATGLRVLVDLSHAALLRASLRGGPRSARDALTSGLRALSVRTYLRWLVWTLIGLATLCLGGITAADLGDGLAVLVAQLGAYLRYASRGVWLGVALDARRFGNVTRKSAPPVSSSAFPAEMLPP